MIATVTLNPAVDRILYVPVLTSGQLTRVDRISMLPGGKGINAAIMLKKLGQEMLAMGFLGGFIGEFIGEKLRSEGISVAFQHVEGDTRTNIILVEKDGRNTKILEPGPKVTPEEIDQFMSGFERSLTGYEAVIIGGSLPPGVHTGIYRDMITAAKKKGLFTVLDANGAAFTTGLEAAPDLVKPDVRLSSQVLGIDGATEDGRRQIAEQVFAHGAGMLVIAFDQVKHAVYTNNSAFELAAPDHDITNEVVAGDAFLAGLVDALRRGVSTEQSGVWAMATEIAASQDPERRWADPDDVQSWISGVERRETAC